jgi:hypothetical protein
MGCGARCQRSGVVIVLRATPCRACSHKRQGLATLPFTAGRVVFAKALPRDRHTVDAGLRGETDNTHP